MASIIHHILMKTTEGGFVLRRIRWRQKKKSHSTWIIRCMYYLGFSLFTLCMYLPLVHSYIIQRARRAHLHVYFSVSSFYSIEPNWLCIFQRIQQMKQYEHSHEIAKLKVLFLDLKAFKRTFIEINFILEVQIYNYLELLKFRQKLHIKV